MAKAKPLTRVHSRSEQDSYAPLQKSKRYVRANSPKIVHGEQGTKFENIRGRYSEPDQQESEDLKTDKELRSRVLGRRNKLTARVAGLRTARLKKR
jgi:hypothetical protein